MGMPRIRARITVATSATTVTAKEKISARAVTASEKINASKPMPRGNQMGKVRINTSQSTQLEDFCCFAICWFL